MTHFAFHVRRASSYARAILRRPTLALLFAVALPFAFAGASCGGSALRANDPNAPSPSAAGASIEGDDGRQQASASASASSVVSPHEMPKACAASRGSDLCTPPVDFVERLCDRNYADAALALFAKDAPWTRGYLRGKVEAWNASGGASTRAVLAFDEEVVVLRFRAPGKGGIVVSGAGGSYDVLRLDGNCFTLDPENLTTKRPPNPRHGPILFHRFAARTKDALLANDVVRGAYVKRMKECQGATSGEVSIACVRADDGLSAAVAAFVVSGSTVPTPERIP